MSVEAEFVHLDAEVRELFADEAALIPDEFHDRRAGDAVRDAG